MARTEQKKSRRNSTGKQMAAGSGFLFVAAAIIIHLFLIYHFNFTQDDAYITFRYAANFLDGHGLVFNIGERVEGYTNFLWTIFMIAGGLMGVSFNLFSKVLGAAFGISSLILLYGFMSRLANENKVKNQLAPGLTVILLALSYSYAYWASAGLETAGFTFLVLASVYCYLRRSYLIIPSLTLSILMRPEGGLVLAIILVYDLMVQRGVTIYWWATVLLTGLFLAPFAGFKLLYYGSLLPNPFYAKTSFDMVQLSNGLVYAGRYGWHYLAAGVFLIPGIMGLRRSFWGNKFLAIVIASYVLYIILVGGDVLKVHRFFIPILPLMTAFMIFGIFKVFPRTGWKIAAIAAIIAWQLYVPYNFVTTFNQREMDLAYKMSTLMDHLLATDRSDFSLAASTIGMVGYRLRGHHVIDLLGLTDTTIARHPEPLIEGMESTWKESHFNSRYVLSRQPDYILFSTGNKPSAPAERALFMYSQFLDNYRTIGYLINNKLQSIYKRYYPIKGAIARDVDVQFGKNYNRAINLWGNGDYTEALMVIDSALSLSPEPKYPYLYYYRASCYLHLQNITLAYENLKTMVSLDTLVYEGLKDLYLYEYRFGNFEAANKYRAMTAKLVPWYIPRLDALVRGGRK